MNTDTPRTDAFFFRTDIGWDEEVELFFFRTDIGRDDEVEFARQLERELAESQAQSHGLARRVVEAETKLEAEIANRKKCCQDGNALSDELFDRQRELKALQAKIKEIRAALGDDGRRTHNEILELAFKASGWKIWKEKYIDLKNAHIAEGQDPAGTIWEHADKLQKELKASNAALEQMTEDAVNFKAEVERLKKELDVWDYGTRAKREQARAEKAEAEVAKINHQLLNTESDLIQSQAEVERLRSQLKRAVEIARAFLKLVNKGEPDGWCEWDFEDKTKASNDFANLCKEIK
jgi:chromosome segregation ATPase